jgi:hypothetical protein
MTHSKRLSWMAACICAILTACGGGGGDASGPISSSGPRTTLSLPAGPWSDSRVSAPAPGVAVWIPDAVTGTWTPAPDGTAVEITSVDAPGSLLASGTTRGGRWAPSQATASPGPALRVTATVSLPDGTTRRMRSLYALDHADVSVGSEALVAWLEPQIADPAVRARFSNNEAAQLQELGALATDATLHRAVTVDAAVDSARDVIVNLSRLPDLLAIALRDGTDATSDADWLDLVTNREGDRIGLHSRVAETLALATGPQGQDHWELITLNHVARDEGGLVSADGIRKIAGTSVSPFMSREGHALYWDDSALSVLSTGIEAAAYQLASAVPVLAFPLKRQGRLWSEHSPVADAGVDLDGDGQNDLVGADAFVDTLGVEDLHLGNRSMRALHVRRNMTLTLQLSSDMGATSLFALRVDAWHVPGIGLVHATRQLVFQSAKGDTSQTAAVEDVDSGTSNGFSIDAAARLYYGTDPVSTLLPDPRGDRVFAQPPFSEVAALHLKSLALSGGLFAATPALDIDNGRLVNVRTGVDGRSVYLDLGHRDAAGNWLEGVWRWDVTTGQATALGALPLITYDDPLGGASSPGWMTTASSLAPAPTRPQSPLVLLNAVAYSTLSTIGRPDGSSTVVSLLAGSGLGRGVLSDTNGLVINVRTPDDPTSTVSEDGTWLYFSGFTQPNGRTGNNVNAVYRWSIGAHNPEPVVTGQTLVGRIGSALVTRSVPMYDMGARLALVDPTSKAVLSELDLKAVYPDLINGPACSITPWNVVFCHGMSSAGHRAIWVDMRLQVQRTAMLRSVPGNFGATLVPLRDGSVAVLDTSGSNIESAVPFLWREDPRLQQSD